MNSKRFKELIDKVYANPKCKQLHLDSFLIKPMQRLCKYPLFLSNLLKLYKPESPAWKDLHSSLRTVEGCITQVNKKVKQVENLIKLVEIQLELENGDHYRSWLLKPGVEFISKDELLVDGVANYIYLFNQFMFITTKPEEPQSEEDEEDLDESSSSGTTKDEKVKIEVLALINYKELLFRDCSAREQKRFCINLCHTQDHSVHVNYLIQLPSNLSHRRWMKRLNGLVEQAKGSTLKNSKDDWSIGSRQRSQNSRMIYVGDQSSNSKKNVSFSSCPKKTLSKANIRENVSKRIPTMQTRARSAGFSSADYLKQWQDEKEKLLQQIEQIKAERDAALAEANKYKQLYEEAILVSPRANLTSPRFQISAPVRVLSSSRSKTE